MIARNIKHDEYVINAGIFNVNKFTAFVISLTMVAVLGCIDYYTGFELSFSIFYLIPITIVIVFSNFQYAVIISVISSVSWYLADIHSGHEYGHPLMPIWNSDNFKSMNDTFGHQAGDSLLQLLSSIISGNIRPYDIFARMGGDEFVLLLPETDYDKSKMLINRIDETVIAELKNKDWPVTLSIGAVTFTIFNTSIDEMIKQADQLMYRAKEQGKNSIVHMQNDGGLDDTGDPAPLA